MKEEKAEEVEKPERGAHCPRQQGTWVTTEEQGSLQYKKDIRLSGGRKRGGGWCGSKEHRDQGVKSVGDRKTLNIYFPDNI